MPSPSRIMPLPISAVLLGKRETIYPSLVWNESEALLVDTGFPGQEGLIAEAMASLSVPISRLAAIALTHQDIDHIGCVDALRRAAGRLAVLCTPIERPYVEGPLRPIKLSDEAIARALDSLGAEVSAETRAAFKAGLENPPRPRVDASVRDGERVGPAGELLVIATPGHTPGHACYYHEPTGTLVAGDALRLEGGALVGPERELCADFDAAMGSLRRLAELEISSIICHHGGLFAGDAAALVSRISKA
jgi:glyoxylase-like metal-dependent hydrolase (beta-lactamase superfamily II)